MNVTATLQSINKALGAVIGAGIVTLLVGVGVIPSDVGVTITAVLTGVAGVLGAFLAPKNKPINTNRVED